MVPIKTVSGKYLTGLDENADNILKILDPKVRKEEQEKIKALKTVIKGIKADFGANCKDHSNACISCHAKLALVFLKSYLDDLNSEEI